MSRQAALHAIKQRAASAASLNSGLGACPIAFRKTVVCGFLLLPAILGACATNPRRDIRPLAPKVAYHQHLLSPATAELIKQPQYNAAALIAHLDAAGIERGVILSMGYTYADERKGVPDPDRRVREENDWTADQVAGSRGRLIGLCSVNPLRDAAMAEIDRCTRLPHMRGLKLHFGNSGVTLRDPAHIERLVRVFAAANARRAPIVVHMRARNDGSPYGPEDTRLFIARLLPAAPDIVVQVAHLAGSGGFPEDAQQAMDAFADALARKDARVRNVYFDLTTVANGATTAGGEQIARAIRSVGVDRVLFGTDLPLGGNPPPAEAWALFRASIPLADAEFRAIARNVAPYARLMSTRNRLR